MLYSIILATDDIPTLLDASIVLSQTKGERKGGIKRRASLIEEKKPTLLKNIQVMKKNSYLDGSTSY